MVADILVPLPTYPDPCSNAWFPAAVAIGRHLGASITGLALEVDFPDVSNPVAEALLHLRDQIRAAERRSHWAADELLEHLGSLCGPTPGYKPRRIRDQPPLLADATAVRARFHDLVVLPVTRQDAASRALAEAIVFGSGRPVIILPDVAADNARLDVVVVATDFGRAATRALFDAHPFLQRAARVEVVTAPDEKNVSHSDRDGLLAHFARHGIPAEPKEIAAGGRPIGEALQEHALASKAGLLVMGAFGHSRLRDFVLGGATETVLYEPRLPILLSY